jgi:preprotein translocase subunit SecY
MPPVARTAVVGAAFLAILALMAVAHHRLFGLRPSLYLTGAAMLLLFAIGAGSGSDRGP